ncbi:3-hydroxyacyl-CoA dehydrogenase NAD-binding domain-containing protein [Streptomyces sp. M19]
MTNERTGPVVVLGAGVMGVGITTLLLGHGLTVRLVETDREQLARAPGLIRRELRMAALMGALPSGVEEGGCTPAATCPPSSAAGW